LKNLVEFKNVYYSFTKAFNVLHNINFCLKVGEKSVIIANNDSGITSFIRILLRDEKVNSGEVLYNNTPIKKISFKKDIFLAYLPSEPVFFDKKSIKFNLHYFLKLHKVQDFYEEDICKYFNIDKNIIVKNLSYFEKVKLAIARFSFRKIQLLIIENIFEKLTEKESLEVQTILNDIIKKNNACVILVIAEKNKFINNLQDFTKYTLKYGTLEKIES